MADVPLSIATVTKDDAEGLARTIQSVRKFAPDNVEYVVVDGSAGNAARALLGESQDIVDHWVSEPDSGIYDAMNKATRLCSGAYICFLNSGDELLEGNPLHEVGTGAAGIYYTDATLRSAGRDILVRYPAEIIPSFFVSGTLNHQNTVISRRLLESSGGFDVRYRITADWKFMAQASYSLGAAFSKLSGSIAAYDTSGISSSREGRALTIAERRKGLAELYGALAPALKELVEYRSSVYGDIVARFGYSRTLDTCLRAYRYIARRTRNLGHSARSRDE